MKLGNDSIANSGSDTENVRGERPRKDRRLALLRRSGLFGADTNGAKIMRACALRDLRQAYRLVYDTFLANGYIAANPYGTRIRAFEAIPEAATFVAKVDSRVVGVQSIVMDSPDLGLPSDRCFKRELDSIRAKGVCLCEATNEAVMPAFRKTAVSTELMRCAAAQSCAEKCDTTVTTVSPSHVRFYSLLGFEEAGSVRSYSKDIDDPVMMMALDMNRLRRHEEDMGECERFVRNFLWFESPYVSKMEAWQYVAHRSFRDANFLRRLFVTESNLLAKCTERERQAIRRRWGDALFSEVVGGRLVKPAYKPSHYVPARPPRAKQVGTGSDAAKKGLRQA